MDKQKFFQVLTSVSTIAVTCLMSVNPVQSQSSNLWVIKNSHSNLCLNVLNRGLQNGDNIVQADKACSFSSSKWTFKAIGDGYYNITALHSDMCLNVLNFGGNNGDNVVQARDCNQYSSQWKLVKVSNNNRYNIVARHSGLCLNVLNKGTSNGNNVVQARDCRQESSKWYFNRKTI